jgi:hypothetical protein
MASPLTPSNDVISLSSGGLSPKGHSSEDEVLTPPAVTGATSFQHHDTLKMVQSQAVTITDLQRKLRAAIASAKSKQSQPCSPPPRQAGPAPPPVQQLSPETMKQLRALVARNPARAPQAAAVPAPPVGKLLARSSYLSARQAQSTIDSLLALTAPLGADSTLKTLIKHDLRAFYRRLVTRAVALLATLTSQPTAAIHASAPWQAILATQEVLFTNLEPQQRDATDRAQRHLPASTVMIDTAAWRDMWALTDKILLACLGPYPGEAIDIWSQFQLDRDQRFTKSVIRQISWADALNFMTEVTQAEFPHLRAAAHEGSLVASRHARSQQALPLPNLAAPSKEAPTTSPSDNSKKRTPLPPWASRATVPPAKQAPGRAQWIVNNICRRSVSNSCPSGPADCPYCHNPAALGISSEEVVAAHAAHWEATRLKRKGN